MPVFMRAGAAEVLGRCMKAEGGRAFQRPLTFGDPEQIRVLAIMNGPDSYCPNCFGYVTSDSDEIGDECPECHSADLIPGEGRMSDFLRATEVRK